MYTLTKIALMWERLGEVIKDVAGIHKTIDDNKAYTPPAYSSTPFDTGKRWNNRIVYGAMFEVTPTEAGSIYIGSIPPNCDVLMLVGTMGVGSYDTFATVRYYRESATNNIRGSGIAETSIGLPIRVYVEYCLPVQPTTAREDPEPEQETKTKRKTTKKEDK